MFVKSAVMFLLILYTCSIFPLIAAKGDCTGYKCLKKLEGKDLNELDGMCRNSRIGIDRFCYCCGGVTNYHIYGTICNRYCLKLFSRESVSFSKPCRLTKEKREELMQIEEQTQDTIDIRSDSSRHDRPFPSTPQKMPLEFITCSSPESPTKVHTYADFAEEHSNSKTGTNQPECKSNDDCMDRDACSEKNNGTCVDPCVIVGSFEFCLENQICSSSNHRPLCRSIDRIEETGIHEFTQSMLSKMLSTEKNTEDNFVFSPFSLHVTLAMLTSASTDDSNTQKELLKALGGPESIQKLSSTYKALLEQYEENSNLLTFGNAVWTRSSFFNQLDQKFFETLDTNYMADFKVFVSEPAKDINKWVQEKTKGKIQEIIDNVPEDVELLLTNALYFKDSWTKPFEPMYLLQNYTLSNGTTIQVKMMYRDSADFLFVPNLTFGSSRSMYQALSIPYNSLDSRFEMILLKPVDSQGLDDFGHLLQQDVDQGQNDQNILDKITSELDVARSKGRPDITVEMPMFTIKSDVPVLEHMRKMGVKSAFDYGDFDKLSKINKMKVTAIKHRAVIEVTKEGTVGVAATGVEIGVLSANLFPTFARFDKPFFFFVRDRRSENLLFAGYVNNPTL